MKIITALVALFMLLFFSAGAVAQTDEIEGTVKDALGMPLSGVSLILKSPDETIMGQTKTDANGHFVFSSVKPGTCAVLAEKPGFQASTAIVTVEAGTMSTTTLTLATQEPLVVSVECERLNQTRNSLSPKTGGSEYTIDQAAIAALPQGENTSFNQVMLQAPGVANDSFGQLHVRGDHANLQYRINGIILPEGISGFGQSLDTRFIDRVDLLDGALPAQYGLRTAGVIEIQTKANFETGGSVDMYGGSFGTVEPSFQFGGSKGNMSYYLTGSFLRDNLGIENPAPTQNAIHDQTDQYKGFGYVSYLINPTSRLSLMFGTYDGWFQVPNNPGQAANPAYLAGTGIAGFDSSSLNERQYETNRYGIIAFQSSFGPDFDYQLSYVTHLTSVHFTPDTIGDLVFNGVASNVFRSSFSNGLQGDGSYHLNDAHTIRVGYFANYEDIKSNNTSTVFPVDANGNVSGGPFTITDNNPKNGNTLVSLYLQDEWKPLDKLTVNYGLRYDRVDAFVDASQLSPRLGLVYKATPDTTLHAAYAREFTPPPTELVQTKSLDLFANTSNASSSNLNSPVEPERDHYFDAGVTQKITSALTVGVDAYYKIIKEMIDEGQFGQAIIYTPFNYDQGRIHGVELTGNYRSGNFAAYINYANSVSMGKGITSGQFEFTQTELNYLDTNWSHTCHDQRNTVSAGISYNWLGTLYTADGTYGSGLRSGDVNESHVPANIQVNLGAMRKFELGCLGPMEARLSIVNVLDRSNIIRDGTGIGVFAPQYGPRIGFFAGISKLF